MFCYMMVFVKAQMLFIVIAVQLAYNVDFHFNLNQTYLLLRKVYLVWEFWGSPKVGWGRGLKI